MSDQATPRTYRNVLLPIVGAEALREAESRVYDQEAPFGVPGLYQCRSGYCAVGVLWQKLDYSGHDAHFPDNTIAATDAGLLSKQHRSVAVALGRIIRANDSGDLATPGSLTALLDAEVR